MVKPIEKKFPDSIIKYIKEGKKGDDAITKIPTDFSGTSVAMEDSNFEKAKKIIKKQKKEK